MIQLTSFKILVELDFGIEFEVLWKNKFGDLFSSFQLFRAMAWVSAQEMVLTSILRRKSVSDTTSQSTDTLDQLTSFLKDLENEALSACAECTRRRLLDLVCRFEYNYNHNAFNQIKTDMQYNWIFALL